MRPTPRRVCTSVTALLSALLPAALALPIAAALSLPASAQVVRPAAVPARALPAVPGAGLVGGVLSASALHQALGLGTASLQALELPAAPAPGSSVHVRLVLDGADCDVVLLPHSLRAADFRLLVTDAAGVLHAQAPAAPVTYRGTIAGMPQSVVAASLVDGQLSAVIRLDPSRPVWGVQPATDVDGHAPRALHVVYDSADVSLPAATCGAPDGRPATQIPGSFSAADPGDKICEIACDTDFEFYSKNGSSVTTTMNDVETVINAVEAIYDADVGILYTITAILVHTSEPDAYTATASNALLSQFTQNWNSTQGGIHRDVAHLLTGKELDGNIIGLAQLGVVCNLSAGYGLVQSKYTGNLAFRAALSAHEIGHNWNANHCDGEPDCSIMCSGLGGCSGNISSFNTSSKTAILAKKAVSGCLDDAIPPPPPVLASVGPASVQALAGGTVSLTGSGFLKVTDVIVGSVSVAGTTGFTVQDDTHLSFAPPAPLALGAVPVVASGPGGASAPGTLTYVETDPPKLITYGITVTSFPFPWLYGGGANDQAFLIIGLTPATFTYQGQSILATTLILQSAPLSAVGLASLTLTLPLSASGLTFYSQAVTLDAGTVKASNIGQTFVIL